MNQFPTIIGGEPVFFDKDFDYGSVEELLEDEKSRDQDLEFGSVSEFLEVEERREKQRLQSEKQEVENVLEKRRSIYNSVKEELDEEIRIQVEMLENAASSPDDDREARIRNRLRDLYQERREELRSYWRDCESWIELKMDLVRRLDELEQVWE